MKKYSLFHALFLFICGISPNFKKKLWKLLYQLLISFYSKQEWAFMNYGFAPVAAKPDTVNLDKRDESNRYFIQLYDHVTEGVTVKNRDVLEVGSGRGGGADYISRYLEPKSMTGVDLSTKVVEFCNKSYSSKILSFVNGDAELLPFDDTSFDIVFNIESSHCYSDMESFLNEVHRVLKPGGFFLFADLRDHDKVELLRDQISGSPFKVIQHRDITGNILKALKLDSHNRMQLFKRFVPKFLLDSFHEFAGTEISRIYRRFAEKRTFYYSYTMQKS